MNKEQEQKLKEIPNYVKQALTDYAEGRKKSIGIPKYVSDIDFLLGQIRQRDSLISSLEEEKWKAANLLQCVLDDDRFEFGKLNPHNGIKKAIQDYLKIIIHP